MSTGIFEGNIMITNGRGTMAIPIAELLASQKNLQLLKVFIAGCAINADEIQYDTKERFVVKT